MFVRWNSTLNIYEYDTSAGQTGAGPWVQLPNIPYKNQQNTFTDGQIISRAGPALTFMDTGQPVNARRWNIINTAQLLYFQAADDAQTVEHIHVQFDRAGRIFERSRAVAMGDWQDVPFNSANFFSGSGGTWTVTAENVAWNRYTLIGKTIIWTLKLNSTVVSGSVNTLQINTPAGIVIASGANAIAFNYAQGPGVIQVDASGTTVSFVKFDISFWAASTHIMATFIGALS